MLLRLAPRVRLDLIEGVSQVGMTEKHFFDQIFKLDGWFLHKTTPESLGILPEQVVVLGRWKWALAHVHDEQTNSE